MPCTLFRVVPCCLMVAQSFLLYVAPFGALACNNRTHCILRMFPDSVFLAPLVSRFAFCLCTLALLLVWALRLPSAFIFWHRVSYSGRFFFENWVSTAGYQFLSFHPLYIMCCICAHTKVFSFSSRSASTIVPHCSVLSCCSSLIAFEIGVIVTHPG